MVPRRGQTTLKIALAPVGRHRSEEAEIPSHSSDGILCLGMPCHMQPDVEALSQGFETIRRHRKRHSVADAHLKMTGARETGVRPTPDQSVLLLGSPKAGVH